MENRSTLITRKRNSISMEKSITLNFAKKSSIRKLNISKVSAKHYTRQISSRIDSLIIHHLIPTIHSNIAKYNINFNDYYSILTNVDRI